MNNDASPLDEFKLHDAVYDYEAKWYSGSECQLGSRCHIKLLN